MDDYPRYLEEGFQPYDPLELMRRTEEVACRGEARKYTNFYSTGVYGGIATGYAVGCCLRCIFCWVDFSRDFPETWGEFYTPEQATGQLLGIARRKRVPRLRISGGEPTGYGFILGTNGIPIAADEDYAELARYTCVYVRVSLKAGTAQGFEARTEAQGGFWELPFVAVERLLAAGTDFHVAAMTDSRLMPEAERGGAAGAAAPATQVGWRRSSATPNAAR